MAGEPKLWAYQDLWGDETDTPKVRAASLPTPSTPPTTPPPYDGPVEGQQSIFDILLG